MFRIPLLAALAVAAAHPAASRAGCDDLLRDVPSQWAPAGQRLTPENIDQLIEEPLRAAIRILLQKNVPTSESSANKNGLSTDFFEDGVSYSYIALDFDRMSTENRAVLLALVPQELPDSRIGKEYTTDGGRVGTHLTRVTGSRASPTGEIRVLFVRMGLAREIVANVFVPMTETTTVGELSKKWEALANRFQAQETIESRGPTPAELDARIQRVLREIAPPWWQRLNPFRRR